MMTQNLCDKAKAVLRGKFITIQSYFKIQEIHQIDDLALYLTQLEKGWTKNSEVSKRKEIIKIWVKEIKKKWNNSKD